MAERPNRRDGIARGLVLTIVAILLLSAVRVEAGLFTRGLVAGGGVGGVVYGGNKTKENCLVCSRVRFPPLWTGRGEGGRQARRRRRVLWRKARWKVIWS